ncbi:hypothetical protein [Pseudoalteromonas peptidolytica]|uniref:hypothetical protein n=1 Tax=Pseudoalteromonas peptidolytica TaxID=61150 RepID=UPI00298E0FD7|nr:hypothetical protein [Pseudoalteromonas peptidolytica]MDW7548472.1 hypothetical protein [Pseudoalteromonas peptidolytica]
MNKNIARAIFTSICLLGLAYVSDAESATRKMYDSELCYTCDTGNALSFAKKYEPEITCYEHGGSVDHNDSQRCYSNPKDVLIINANTNQKWLYKLSHSNQGGWRHELTNNLQAVAQTVPHDASNLADELIKYYDAWDRATTKVSQEYNSSSMQSTLAISTNTILQQMLSENNCENEAFTRVAKLAFDGRTKTTLQERTEKALIEEYGSLGAAFETTRMTQFGYTVGVGNVGFSGQAEYVPKRRMIDLKFHDAISGNHRVVYNLDFSKGIRMDLNKDMTKFGGVSVRSLHQNPASRNKVSNCMLETLNIYREASVKSSGTSGGGIDLPPAVGRHPGRSYGESGEEFCTWTFYDPWGEILFTMMGSCPLFPK